MTVLRDHDLQVADIIALKNYWSWSSSFGYIILNVNNMDFFSSFGFASYLSKELLTFFFISHFYIMDFSVIVLRFFLELICALVVFTPLIFVFIRPFELLLIVF
jgi:hypothetical protein